MPDLCIRQLGLQPYVHTLKLMQDFTTNRDASTADEVWLVEHFPVYTQGQAGKDCHVLARNTIPLIKSDRGGQITYHGPGQLVIYVLMDLARKKFGVRDLVSQLESIVIDSLKHWGISAQTKHGAPGVFVENKKIASIGLRVKKGCTYHGIALNISMDLEPFKYINPCGDSSLKMTQVCDFFPGINMPDVIENLLPYLSMEHA